MSQFTNLFQPIRLRHKTLRNRIVFGAHTANMSEQGLPSYHDSDGSHQMSESEILEIIAAFARAAVRCQKAGFDGVDVFAAYHSLLEQFWSSWSNHRHDQWGGSLENRARLSLSIIDAIRAACGEEFIIGLSIGYAESTPFVMSLEDFQAVITLHDQTAQLDYVSCGPAPCPTVSRTTADFQVRSSLNKAGARFMVESVIEQWQADGAQIRSLLDGSVSHVTATSLVTATTNMACNDIELALDGGDVVYHVIGDCAAPRSAPYAFHEGRKIGLTL